MVLLASPGAFCAQIECFRTLVATGPHAPDYPPSIAKTKRSREYPNAVDAYGDVIKAGEKLSPEQVKDGIYVYVIAHANGQRYLIWSLRAPGAIEGQPGKNLVTHDSLLEQLSRKLGIPASQLAVHGAGQSQILHGEVSSLDNKSGSRRGNAEHLAYAETFLKSAGLKILPAGAKPTTQRIDFAKMEEGEEDIHAEADEQAQVVVEVRNDPRLRELGRQIGLRHQRLYEEFPELRDAETPGYLDPNKILARAEIDPEKKLAPTDAFNLSMYRLALRYYQKDGPEFAAKNIRELNEAEVLKWIDWGIEQHRARRTSGNR